MRRAEHERIVALLTEADGRIVAALEAQITFLQERNEDLLNRAMSQDWTQYTALSAEAQPAYVPVDMLYDATGLIAVEADE